MKDKDYINLNPDGDDRYPLADTPPFRSLTDPEIAIPDFNPPVPNRAWTAMKQGKDIDELSEEERRMLYYGRDGIL